MISDDSSALADNIVARVQPDGLVKNFVGSGEPRRVSAWNISAGSDEAGDKDLEPGIVFRFERLGYPATMIALTDSALSAMMDLVIDLMDVREQNETGTDTGTDHHPV